MKDRNKSERREEQEDNGMVMYVWIHLAVGFQKANVLVLESGSRREVALQS